MDISIVVLNEKMIGFRGMILMFLFFLRITFALSVKSARLIMHLQYACENMWSNNHIVAWIIYNLLKAVSI